jgi:hypothetical protein
VLGRVDEETGQRRELQGEGEGERLGINSHSGTIHEGTLIFVIQINFHIILFTIYREIWTGCISLWSAENTVSSFRVYTKPTVAMLPSLIEDVLLLKKPLLSWWSMAYNFMLG